MQLAAINRPICQIGERDRAALDALASLLAEEIEALVDHKAYLSDRAITPRGTQHTVVKNGYITEDREDHPPSKSSPLTMAFMALEAARTLRLKIEGDAYVVWRIKPEFSDDRRFYMRLCFEAI